ncbi:MAG: RagB/SusD family nutrient uptake outer membrane protein, partial [Bacteroidia bacterium]|nr:RagB/SusD family nutrient uptake outer membrane protein [Bacteroidia bacterium]
MKKVSKYLFIVGALFFATSCEDYLNRPKESELAVEDVFKDFAHAQGFVEVMYRYVVNYACTGNQNDGHNFLLGDEVISTNTGMLIYKFDLGRLNEYNLGYFDRPDFQGTAPAWEQNYPTLRPGIWDGWKAIRMANIVLDNMDKMTGATEKEKKLIRGQALFFRAYFHAEILKYWGRIPYIDFVVTGNDDDFKIPRPATYKECAMKADADFAAAAELLPNNWDDLQNDPTATFLTFKAETFGNNLLRINKAIVYAFKGKNLLFAASPLMKGSTDTYDYDQELCELAAADFARVIQMDRDNVNDLGLANKDNYNKLFYTGSSSTEKTQWPGTAKNMGNGQGEFIFSSVGAALNFTTAPAKSYMPYGSYSNPIEPTHNFIHRTFGTANGLACEEDPTYNSQKEFENRDPRFYKNLIIDGDTIIRSTAASTKYKFAQCYTNGLLRTSINSFHTGYFIKKWCDVTFNLPTAVKEGTADNISSFNSFRLSMRLTDVYLMYAEALAATSKYGVNTAPNYDYLPYAPSSIDVINMIRARFDVKSVESAYQSIGINIVSDAHKFM